MGLRRGFVISTMVVAIKLADKIGTVDVPSTYTEITIGAGLIHSYIKGLEPHQVPREMTFYRDWETDRKSVV